MQLILTTPRLKLIAATAELARADIVDRARFAVLLDARIPDSWPIETMKDAQEPFAQALESGATTPGWGGWYIIGEQALRGAVGFYGDPDAQGVVTTGYGVVPECEGQGITTEALAALVAWAVASGRVTLMRATTFEQHWASIRILEKNGFVCQGVSPDDAQAADSDRQGRGRLMNWQR